MTIQVGKLYECPSGCGGSLTVQVLRIAETDNIHAQQKVDCRVYEPLNPDWHGWLVCCDLRDLKPSPEPLPPKNWLAQVSAERR